MIADLGKGGDFEVLSSDCFCEEDIVLLAERQFLVMDAMVGVLIDVDLSSDFLETTVEWV